MFRNVKFIIFMILLSLSVSGCVSVNSNQKQNLYDGGVFRTNDQGTTWQQKVLISSVKGAPGSFGGLNLASMANDPSDVDTFYFGSVNNGLFYTYDGAESWQTAKSLGLKTIHSIAVDEKEHCNIFVGAGNRIYKTKDCSRSWQEIYYDNETTAVIDSLVVDHYDNNNVYAAISRGDLIKSYDGGENWQTLNRFGDRIKQVIIDPNDSRIVYVVTTNKGVFRSMDGGATWLVMEVLNETLKAEELGIDIRDFLLVDGQPGTIFLATYYGLLRSMDAGESWDNIELILPSTKATINAITINPQDLNQIFYVTNTTFYRSSDGGQTWSTLKLPSTRAGVELFTNPKQPNIMYLGVK